MIFDSHCHLVSDKLKDNLPQLLERAKEAGISDIINVSYDMDSARTMEEQLRSFPLDSSSIRLYGTAGIQPHDAHAWSPNIAEQLRKLAKENPRIVAIGEIGLDAYYELSPMYIQKECFEYFLSVACDESLPVIIHVRETHAEVLERLKPLVRERSLTGVIHCFTGTKEEARDFLELGFLISFSGIVTFKTSDALREVAAYVPRERLLIETDAPYLAPMPCRGKLNEPAFVSHTAKRIAEIRKSEFQTLCHDTWENAMNLFIRAK